MKKVILALLIVAAWSAPFVFPGTYFLIRLSLLPREKENHEPTSFRYALTEKVDAKTRYTVKDSNIDFLKECGREVYFDAEAKEHYAYAFPSDPKIIGYETLNFDDAGIAYLLDRLEEGASSYLGNKAGAAQFASNYAASFAYISTKAQQSNGRWEEQNFDLYVEGLFPKFDAFRKGYDDLENGSASYFFSCLGSKTDHTKRLYRNLPFGRTRYDLGKTLRSLAYLYESDSLQKDLLLFGYDLQSLCSIENVSESLKLDTWSTSFWSHHGLAESSVGFKTNDYALTNVLSLLEGASMKKHLEEGLSLGQSYLKMNEDLYETRAWHVDTLLPEVPFIASCKRCLGLDESSRTELLSLDGGCAGFVDYSAKDFQDRLGEEAPEREAKLYDFLGAITSLFDRLYIGE